MHFASHVLKPLSEKRSGNTAIPCPQTVELALIRLGVQLRLVNHYLIKSTQAYIKFLANTYLLIDSIPSESSFHALFTMIKPNIAFVRRETRSTHTPWHIRQVFSHNSEQSFGQAPRSLAKHVIIMLMYVQNILGYFARGIYIVC